MSRKTKQCQNSIFNCHCTHCGVLTALIIVRVVLHFAVAEHGCGVAFGLLGPAYLRILLGSSSVSFGLLGSSWASFGLSYLSLATLAPPGLDFEIQELSKILLNIYRNQPSGASASPGLDFGIRPPPLKHTKIL